MNDNDIAISVTSINKNFKLPHEKHNSLKSRFVNIFDGRMKYKKQEALKDISFEIKKGEFFGIIGRNGSGKSTLLKLMAGIYAPNGGNIQVNGKLTPFIELGVGFNPELSGRENVFLNGALLGFSRKEMERKYKHIVEFAELEEFMDQKLKNYSSGMQVRLAFSIAVQSQSSILLFDEVLAVGDANFQKKCYDVFKKIKNEGKTVVLVTHDMSAVEQYCDRAILIEKGNVVAEGDPRKITKSYNDLNLEVIDKNLDDSPYEGDHTKRQSQHALIEKIWLEKNSKKTRALGPEDKISVRIKISALEEIKNPVVGITIKDQVGKPLFATNTKAFSIETGEFKKGDKFLAKIEIDNIFSDGNYYIVPGITSEDTETPYDSIEDGHRFSVSGWTYPAFVMQPKHKITIEK